MSTLLDKAAYAAARKAVAVAASNTSAIDAIAIDPRAMGAMADGWQFADGTVTAGNLTHISFANHGWQPSAVSVGNAICVIGGAAGGLPLATTIAGFIAPATIVLASPVAGAMTNAAGDFGTDDTAAVQAAINAAAASGAIVDFGGPSEVFYIAAASAQYPVGFSRGSLIVPSNVTMRGNGSVVLLSGGRVKPGGIFYNQFWLNPAVPTRNVCFDGMIVDGNIAAQYWPPLPANFTDAQVWQWGHAIALINIIGFEARNCVVRNVRGDGMNITSYLDTGNVYHANRMARITGCEFSNVFGNGVACDAIGTWIERNWFHGDGYWVAAVNIETNAAGGVGQLQAVTVADNVFDFRDGLSPVERTPAYATNSAQALAARIHLRRCFTFGGYAPGLPGGSWNGTLMSVTVRGNTVWQGVSDASDFRDLTYTGNRFVNTYEAITGNPHVIGADTIYITTSPGTGVTGLERVVIEGNSIDSGLAGHGIEIFDYGHARVVNNVIVNAGAAGIRFASVSGHICGNEIRDCGSAGTGDPSDVYGIAIYGGQSQPLDVTGNQAIDTRGSGAVLVGSVYANVGAGTLTTIADNSSQGFAGTVNDVGGTTLMLGNRSSAAQGWTTNLPLSTSGALGVLGTVTLGDASGSHDGALIVKRAASGVSAMLFADGTGISYQIAQTGSGGVVMQNFAHGAYQWTDMAFSGTGALLMNLTWQKPMVANGNTFLWVCQTAPNAGQCRKKVGGAPASDTDGSAGWS